MKGFVLAGTASGVGKTVASLVVMQALQDVGKTVQPAKAGPDFIDPSHHAAVAGRPSRTLDVWMEGPHGVRRNYARGTGDVTVVEGVMGLYDGDASSTAMVAEILDLPVVLVVDASAGMESVAASALGFQQYAARVGRDIEVAGILAQKAHGGRHEREIKAALPEELVYFGRIPPASELSVPDRHLGLHMGSEDPLAETALQDTAAHVKTDRLLDVATKAVGAPAAPRPPSTDACVAVARDEAFSFYYPATLERLRGGARVKTFSPIAGDPLPPCDGVYLPGGYPERFASELEASRTLDTLRSRAEDGLPVYGECGGLMALSRTLETTAGETVEMAGVLPAAVEMRERYQALDHVELEATTDTLTVGRGHRLRGHEFHYSSAKLDSDATLAFSMRRGEGLNGTNDGLTEYATLGTYTHLHPESGAFDAFLERLGQTDA